TEWSTDRRESWAGLFDGRPFSYAGTRARPRGKARNARGSGGVFRLHECKVRRLHGAAAPLSQDRGRYFEFDRGKCVGLSADVELGKEHKRHKRLKNPFFCLFCLCSFPLALEPVPFELIDQSLVAES